MDNQFPRRERNLVRSLSMLGLKEHPFQASADPRFLYLSNNHLGIIERLETLIYFRQGLAVIEGRVGTGKTSLARRIREITDQDDGFVPSYIHTAAYATHMEAAKDIAWSFGLQKRRGYADQLHDIELFLLDVREQGKTAVLLLDDAQFMQPDSLDAIQNLLNFDYQRQKLIQIILFGQQEIRSNFAEKPAINDRVIAWQSLGSLTFPEMIAMIDFRLTVAGRTEPMFSEQALERLYDFSQGIPRRTVVVCGEVIRLLIENTMFSADTEIIEAAIEHYRQRP